MQVEINTNFQKATDSFQVGNSTLAITPPIDDNYWIFRVKIFKDQAIQICHIPVMQIKYVSTLNIIENTNKSQMNK